MKTVYLTIVCSCMILAGTFAQANMTPAQKTFQNKLINFLKEEGYSPSLNSDNIINFKSKSDDELHFILIGGASPFLVILERFGYPLEGEKSLDKTKSIIACNTINAKKEAVKFYCTDKRVEFTIEQYIHSEEDFFFVFDRYMKILKKSKDEFVDEYILIK